MGEYIWREYFSWRNIEKPFSSEEIVNALDLRRADGQVTTSGRDCIKVFYGRFHSKWGKNQPEKVVYIEYKLGNNQGLLLIENPEKSAYFIPCILLYFWLTKEDM